VSAAKKTEKTDVEQPEKKKRGRPPAVQPDGTVGTPRKPQVHVGLEPWAMAAAKANAAAEGRPVAGYVKKIVEDYLATLD
jgi:hypothetical protein